MNRRNFIKSTVAVVALSGWKPISGLSQTKTIATSNPLLEEWHGPSGGVPPFDRVQIADFKPALETAMAKNLVEIDKIAMQTAPPTFENTIAALERSGDRISSTQGRRLMRRKKTPRGDQ